MSVFEAVKPQFGPSHTPLNNQQPFAQQPFGPQQPYAPQQQFMPQQPYSPQQYFLPQQQYFPQQYFVPQHPFGMPQQYMPQQPFPFQQPFGPQQYFTPQQPFGPQQPFSIPPAVADVAARFAPHAIAAIVEIVRAEPAALPSIQATGQLPPQVYPMVLMEIANRIAPVLQAMMIPAFPGIQPNPFAQPQPVPPMAYAGR